MKSRHGEGGSCGTIAGIVVLTTVQMIADFNTATLGQPTPPAGWSTPSGGGLNLVTDITVDSLGRATLVLGPWHTIDIAGVATSIRRATFYVYQDGQFQTWVGQGYATASVGNGLRAVPEVVQPPSAGIGTAHLLPLPSGEGRGEGGLPLIPGDGAYSFTLINPGS